MENMSLYEKFEKSFLTHKKKIAITFVRNGKPETEISYEKLLEDCRILAGIFTDMGVQKGDRVILYLPKSLFFVAAYLGILKTGAIAVPLNPGFKKSEMEYLAGDADAKLIITGPEQKPVIDAINKNAKNKNAKILVIDTLAPYQNLDIIKSSVKRINPGKISLDDPALIIYTSGTTGNPKGAMLTNKNLIHDADNIIKIWEIKESDTLCHALPLFHVHGLCFALHTMLLAGAHVIMSDAFSPQTVIDILTNNKSCTVFMAVPPIYVKLMDYMEKNLGKKYDFSHIRLFTSGSAPLLVKDFEKIKKMFGKEPVEREGMSETGMNFSNPIHGKKKPGSIGLPLPGLKIRIVNPDIFEDVQKGEEGEFWLKSNAIISNYWQKPEETKKAFQDGWFRTGDLGKVDKDGYYYLTDRCKHIIISGGENISPKEIESVINSMNGVKESSVVGIPDEKWGEKVVAAVVAKPDAGLKSEDVKKYCKKHLHDWKCPKDVIFIEKLPKNTMGKVLKEKVKLWF